MTVERRDFPITTVQYYAAQIQVKADKILGYKTPRDVVAASQARPDATVEVDLGDIILAVRIIDQYYTSSV